ncbi:MAG: sensor histidine kinase, partial [Alphaproteobacteria bacterium]
LTTITVDGTDQQYILSATQIIMAGTLQKLISLQNVQSQLDATELATWQNLLRVTSHEILNSLSPVSSLAKTTQGLVSDFKNNHPVKKDEKEELDDISDALETLVRRSEGLVGFVQSYRQLTRMPPPKMKKIPLQKYFHRLESLIKADWEKRKIKLDIEVSPKNLAVSADEGMLDQALINLLQNAADALKGKNKPVVKIRAYFNQRNQIIIEVEDNGPGIEKDQRDQIFVPFFTTKRQGSGVGLTLVRYILLSHGGAASYLPAPGGGSIFRLAF